MRRNSTDFTVRENIGKIILEYNTTNDQNNINQTLCATLSYDIQVHIPTTDAEKEEADEFYG